MKRQNKIIVLLLVLLCILITGAIVLLMIKKDKAPDEAAGTEVVDWDTGIREEEPKADEGILIPGYETARLKAGENILKMSIGNPAENTCYMKFTVMLEDETSLYESDILEPGKGVEEMECTTTPAPGQYNAVVRFECYEDEAGEKPLNMADSAFTLEVVE